MKYTPIFLLLCALLLARCSDSGKSETDGLVYTCPMHPEVTSDKPGICHLCEMALVMKSDSDDSLTPLLKRADEYIVADAATLTPTQRSILLRLNTTGIITYDQREMNVVSARVSGRIEKLHVRYRFQRVKRGQPLFDIYSPELITAQEEMIYLAKKDPGNTALSGAARKKLLLLGFTDDQVSQLITTGRHMHTVTIYSGHSGHLHEPSENMNEPSADLMTEGSTGNARELVLKEGAYVQAGQPVLSVFSTGTVWAMLQIHPGQQNVVKKSQKVSLDIDGLAKEATIGFIEPFVAGRNDFATARCYLPNPDGLIRIGAPVKAVINAGNVEGLFVPVQAVVNLGQRNVVYEQKGNGFRATEIESGYRDAGWVQVTYGLDTASVIAANAQFLSDSESFIKSEE